MADTKKCQHCAMDIPVEAKICPHCQKKQGTSTVLKIFLGIIMLGILGSIIGRTSGKKDNPPPITKVSDNVISKNNVVSEKDKKTSDNQTLKTIIDFIEYTKKDFNKYYPTKDTMLSIGRYKELISSMLTRYPDDKQFTSRAKAAMMDLELLSREAYAKAMEEQMLKNGITMNIDATDSKKKTLNIKYALMSKAFVYKLQNEANIEDQARALGFTKVIMTDGFDSTWVLKLK